VVGVLLAELGPAEIARIATVAEAPLSTASIAQERTSFAISAPISARSRRHLGRCTPRRS